MLGKLRCAQAAQSFGTAVCRLHVQPAQAKNVIGAGFCVGFKILRGVQVIDDFAKEIARPAPWGAAAANRACVICAVGSAASSSFWQPRCSSAACAALAVRNTLSACGITFAARLRK